MISRRLADSLSDRPKQRRREAFYGDENLSVISDDSLALSTRYGAEDLPDRFFRTHDDPIRNGILCRRLEGAIFVHPADITLHESRADQRDLHAQGPQFRSDAIRECSQGELAH